MSLPSTARLLRPRRLAAPAGPARPAHRHPCHPLQWQRRHRAPAAGGPDPADGFVLLRRPIPDHRRIPRARRMARGIRDRRPRPSPRLPASDQRDAARIADPPRTVRVVPPGWHRKIEPGIHRGTMTNSTFAVGGDIEVRRLGFGAMRITGPGIWGPPATELPREHCCAGPSIWASSSSTRQTPTAPVSQRSSSPRLSFPTMASKTTSQRPRSNSNKTRYTRSPRWHRERRSGPLRPPEHNIPIDRCRYGRAGREHPVIGSVADQPAVQDARRSPRSVAVDEIQQEVGLPPVTAGPRAFSLTSRITQCDAGTECGCSGQRRPPHVPAS
jgi:hypothetical protein